jgi:hypothetical protein
MYSNAKIAYNIEKNNNDGIIENDILYSIVNNVVGGKDFLILYKGFNDANTQYLILENSELIGKEYEIIIGDSCVYYDKVQKNKNIFPVDNLPLHKIYFHKIFIIIKDIENNKEFDLIVKNMHSIQNKWQEDDYGYISIKWPIIAPKNNFFDDNKLENNFFRIIGGMAGLRYSEYSDKNNYDDEYIDNNKKYIYGTNKKFNINNNIKLYNIKAMKIFHLCEDNNNYKDNNIKEKFSIYSINKILSVFFDNGTDIDIVIEDRQIQMEQIQNNVHEHLLRGDAIANMQFFCDCIITKILHISSERCVELPFEKTNYGYQIIFDDAGGDDVYMSNFLDSKLCIHSNNNNPIIIKYDICIYKNELRKDSFNHIHNSKDTIVLLTDNKPIYKDKKIEINQNIQIIL